MAAFGPLNRIERQAAIRLAEHEAAVELERLEHAGGRGYDRGTRLMKPGKFLRQPRRSYNVFVGGHIVQVGVKKKCFIVRRSPPAVPGCRNKINKLGHLTIGFGQGRPTRVPATLAQAKKAWKLVLRVFGITANDLRNMAAATEEEELFGSDNEGSLSSGYTDMPPLQDEPITAESPPDEPISSTDEEPSSTDEEPEAMQVTAGSSTDQPGNTHAGSILQVDEKPMYLPSMTSVHQPMDTDMHQLVTTGYGLADTDLHHLVTTGYFDNMRYLSLSGSHTRNAYLQCLQLPSPRLHLPSTRDRYTIMTQVSPQEPLPACLLAACRRCVQSRVETLRLYEAAPIAVQPDSLVMLTPSVEPHLASMTALDSPCRECVSWHKPYYHRLLLAQWQNIAVENGRARRAIRVNKKQRKE